MRRGYQEGEPSTIPPDPNVVTYNKLSKIKNYQGKYPLIIDGGLIAIGSTQKGLLKLVRGKFLGKIRYIKKLPEQ